MNRILIAFVAIIETVREIFWWICKFIAGFMAGIWASVTTECPMCCGSGFSRDSEAPCEICEGKGRIQ